MTNLNKEIIKTGKNVINIETKTLKNLVKSVDKSFVSCVKLISGISGRVVVSGIGKSAIIGQKIVSTLNSTGTHSIFMHAADAIHGDLGMLKDEDVIICISKSGETSEIKVLISILKSFGNTIIAMTSNKNSYLAKNSNFHLYIPVENEAEPNNLAPTASTVAQMAMGDALAGALLYVKGFSPQHFAKFHPGGSLGKQLYLRVSELFKNNEKPQVRTDSNIRKTILEITSKRLGATAVIDDSEQLAGIITDGDLRRMLETKDSIEKITAFEIMTKKPKTINVNSLASTALEKMRNNSITQLVVIDDDGKYLGFVHIHDILREGII
jgi:arabinose-5-phosphate isomerase